MRTISGVLHWRLRRGRARPGRLRIRPFREGKEGCCCEGFNREWTPMDTNRDICRRINRRERREHKDAEVGIMIRIKSKIRKGKRTSHLTLRLRPRLRQGYGGQDGFGGQAAQWLPKPATSQLPKLGRALCALWSPASGGEGEDILSVYPGWRDNESLTRRGRQFEFRFMGAGSACVLLGFPRDGILVW
jgi:hypothetical protein